MYNNYLISITLLKQKSQTRNLNFDNRMVLLGMHEISSFKGEI